MHVITALGLAFGSISVLVRSYLDGLWEVIILPFHVADIPAHQEKQLHDLSADNKFEQEMVCV